jgi:hypothetical protein
LTPSRKKRIALCVNDSFEFSDQPAKKTVEKGSGKVDLFSWLAPVVAVPWNGVNGEQVSLNPGSGRRFHYSAYREETVETDRELKRIGPDSLGKLKGSWVETGTKQRLRNRTQDGVGPEDRMPAPEVAAWFVLEVTLECQNRTSQVEHRQNEDSNPKRRGDDPKRTR